MTQGMWTLCQHLEMGNIQVQCEAFQRLVQGSTSMWGDPPANGAGAGVKAGGLLSGELPLNDHHGRHLLLSSFPGCPRCLSGP